MKKMYRVSLVVLLAVGVTAYADHDITVPYEAPEGTATVDGDLSDWAGAQWIPLDEVYSGAPTDMFDAKYSLRWSAAENLLYFAVQYTDTHHVLQYYQTWNAQDDIEISIDAGKNEQNFGSYMTYGQQIIFGTTATDDNWVLAAWDSPVGTDLVPEFAVVVDGDVITYEGSIVPYSYYGVWEGNPGANVVVDLEPGIDIGFDVVACTVTPDGFGMMTNNTVGGKFNRGDRLQTWTLVAGADLIPGDANGDGVVDLDDFVILKNNFGVTDATWAMGDFNGDGEVDLDDFVILKNNFGATAVPEPATLSLLALGALALIRRRS